MATVESVLNSSRPGMLSLLPNRKCYLIPTTAENRVKMEGVIVSTTPETKVEQKSSREVATYVQRLLGDRRGSVHVKHM